MVITIDRVGTDAPKHRVRGIVTEEGILTMLLAHRIDMSEPAPKARMTGDRSANKRPRGTKRHGFTLVEVLCALVVTVFGLVSAFYLVAQSTMVNADAKASMAAHLAAQAEVETLRNAPYAALASTTFTPANTNLSTPTGIVTVTAHPGDANSELKDVTVVVGWKDRGNVNRSVVVATTIGKGGIDPQ